MQNQEPSKPTEDVMCAVSTNLCRLGVMAIVIFGDSSLDLVARSCSRSYSS